MSSLRCSFVFSVALVACSAKPPPPVESPATPAEAAALPAEPAASGAAAAAGVPDLPRGGRLYDKWFAEEGLKGTFTPRQAAHVPGQGGPNGDGTLNAAGGALLPNTGHDYRLKNFFGWDLRGSEGIYGLQYQNKAHVHATNLLTDTRSMDELIAWFKAGDAQLPAYGSVMNDAQLREIVAFIVAMRGHELPGPADVWELAVDAPNKYRLKTGGNAEKGRAYIAETCANCHGDDGTEVKIDDEYSLGSFGRAKAYEGWIKVVSGHPGSPMGSQLPKGVSVAEEAQTILDVFAALCDRTQFPGLPEHPDVPDGDPRCGEYLK